MDLTVEPTVWTKAPGGAVTAAMVATNCEAWSEAAELWLDVALQRSGDLGAALCAAESALRSGDFGLADQMIARSPATGNARARLDSVILEFGPIRDARRELFTRKVTQSDAPRWCIEQLIALALYRDAVEAIAGNSYLDEVETRIWLMRAHSGLGEHDLVIGLTDASAMTKDVAPMVDHAHAMIERRKLPLREHRARFVAEHPAASLIAWLG